MKHGTAARPSAGTADGGPCTPCSVPRADRKPAARSHPSWCSHAKEVDCGWHQTPGAGTSSVRMRSRRCLVHLQSVSPLVMRPGAATQRPGDLGGRVGRLPAPEIPLVGFIRPDFESHFRAGFSFPSSSAQITLARAVSPRIGTVCLAGFRPRSGRLFPGGGSSAAVPGSPGGRPLCSPSG